MIEEDLPQTSNRSGRETEGEASLRGHLKSDNGEEQTGSSSYVPKEKEKDKQLQAAIDLLHGKQVVSNVTKPPEAERSLNRLGRRQAGSAPGRSDDEQLGERRPRPV